MKNNNGEKKESSEPIQQYKRVNKKNIERFLFEWKAFTFMYSYTYKLKNSRSAIYLICSIWSATIIYISGSPLFSHVYFFSLIFLVFFRCLVFFFFAFNLDTYMAFDTYYIRRYLAGTSRYNYYTFWHLRAHRTIWVPSLVLYFEKRRCSWQYIYIFFLFINVSNILGEPLSKMPAGEPINCLGLSGRQQFWLKKIK